MFSPSLLVLRLSLVWVRYTEFHATQARCAHKADAELGHLIGEIAASGLCLYEEQEVQVLQTAQEVKPPFGRLGWR